MNNFPQVAPTEIPELDKLADEIANRAILAIVRMVGAHAKLSGVAASTDKDAFEKAATTLIDDLSAEQLDGMKTAVAKSLNMPSSRKVKTFGTLALVDLSKHSSIGKQLSSMRFGERMPLHGTHAAASSDDADKKAAESFIAALKPLAGIQKMQPPLKDGPNAAFFPQESEEGPHLATMDSATVHALLNNPALLDTGHAASGALPTVSTVDFTGIGPIETKYRQLNGADGPLGKKDGDEVLETDHYGRKIRVQFYKNGGIFLGPSNEAFAIWGHIFDHWQKIAGLDKGYIGVPIMDQQRTPNHDGWFCHFYGHGSIYYSNAFGAWEVHGAIRSKWASLSWERGYLGFPESDELPSREPPTYGPIGAYSKFDGGWIYWSVRHGAHALPDPINDIYQSMHAEVGNLGYPVWTSDQPGLHPVNFEGGRITVINGQPQLRPLFLSVTNLLRQAKAIKTTKEIGQDEIELHWLGLDSLGRIQTQKLVLGEFSNGDVYPRMEFLPNFQIALDDKPPHSWPRTYSCCFSLIERDGGQIDNFLLQLIGAVEDGVNETFQKAGELVAERYRWLACFSRSR